MKVLLIDNGTRFLPDLNILLKGNKITTKSYKELAGIVAADFDLIVLSGGSGVSVRKHFKHFENESNMILHSDTPIIGICLGFELIAHLMGASLSKLPVRRINNIKIFPVQKDIILEEIASPRVYQGHIWRVTNLPPELMCLAASKDGVEIVKHKRKPIYGLQFHPEKDRHNNDGPKIFHNIVEQLKLKKKNPH